MKTLFIGIATTRTNSTELVKILDNNAELSNFADYCLTKRNQDHLQVIGYLTLDYGDTYLNASENSKNIWQFIEIAETEKDVEVIFQKRDSFSSENKIFSITKKTAQDILQLKEEGELTKITCSLGTFRIFPDMKHITTDPHAPQ